MALNSKTTEQTRPVTISYLTLLSANFVFVEKVLSGEVLVAYLIEN